MKAKRVFEMAATASVVLLTGCNFGSSCSGSFSDQMVCYTGKYQNDKTAMKDTEDRCSMNKAEKVECRAVKMVKDAPKTIKWLNKTEPYSNKNRDFFVKTSDQIRIDEKSWCVAKAYSDPNFGFFGVSDSCYHLNDALTIGVFGGVKEVNDEIQKINQALK